MGLFTKKEKSSDLNNLTVQEDEIVKEDSEVAGIKTEISYHPDWDITIQEKYVYQYHHQKLPLLQPNQISISRIKLYEYSDGFVITAFLRSSLPKPISFEIIDLVMTNEQNEPVARKRFEMDLFGQLPPKSARPWRFLFSKEDLLVEELPKENWKLNFELKQRQNQPIQLDLEESWKSSLTEEQIAQLENTMKQFPPLKNDEINFAGIQIGKTNSDQDLSTTLFIRNGSDRSIMIENLPLVVEDAAGDIVARGSFQLNKLEVKPFTCKPWTFIFPAQTLQKENPDFSKWKVYVPSGSDVQVNKDEQ